MGIACWRVSIRSPARKSASLNPPLCPFLHLSLSTVRTCCNLICAAADELESSEDQSGLQGSNEGATRNSVPNCQYTGLIQ